MSISGALNNALSGLRATGRGTEVLSANIANATTPGYGRRALELSSSALGGAGGVQIDGIRRAVNHGLMADRRVAEAANAEAKTVNNFYRRLENVIGSPDQPFSISGRIATFESGLISAASRPDAPERLIGSVMDARNLTQSIADASAQVQDARSNADSAIATQVDHLNSYLKQVEELNAKITKASIQNGDDAALHDQRQQLVDQISAIVPVRQVPREHGKIALYSEGGAVLMDTTALEIGFEPVNRVTPYQTIGGGHLSGLTIGGIPVRTDSEGGALRGGALGAHFQVRDELGVEAQTKLDALARDLIERFQDPAVDPSLTLGAPGLFTDDGSAFDPLDELGISARISLNGAVDPDQGGQASRMRDGIGAVTPGDVGDATLLNAMKDALNAPRTPASGSFGPGAFSAPNLMATYASEVGTTFTIMEQQLSFSSARLQQITERQLADGVDTDSELQNLMVLERAYAANARVIQTVDEMMQAIMRI